MASAYWKGVRSLLWLSSSYTVWMVSQHTAVTMNTKAITNFKVILILKLQANSKLAKIISNTLKHYCIIIKNYQSACDSLHFLVSRVLILTINNISIVIMDEDGRKSLLTEKGLPFQKLYEECLVKIQRIRQKNDFMQRQIGSDLEDTIKSEVRRQKQFLEAEISQIKLIMDEIEKRFKDPQSKNKLKNIKTEAQKQIQRNKVIMKDLITKSFLVHSKGATDPNDDQEKYIEGGQIHYDGLQQRGKQSVLTDNSQDRMVEQHVQLDYQIQRKILAQKKQLLDDVEQSTLRVNAIVTDMAVMVDEQGQNLDVISEELLKTQKNVQHTNEQMTQASTLQKKSRKKYILLALLVLFLVGLVLGLVFILGGNK